MSNYRYTTPAPQRKRKTKNEKNKKSFLGAFVAIIITAAVFVSIIIVIVNSFQSSSSDFQKAQYPTKYENIVNEMSQKYQVEKKLIFAVIRTESHFDPDAGSSAGAMGLMQIIPETFEWLQIYYNGEVTMNSEYLYDPEVNIEYGTMFLRYLLEKYSVEETAVAAYNAGFGIVDEWLSDSSYSPDGKTLSYIPYDETANYVVKVENAKLKYESIYNM
ncbi:MAG: lytic transglycosylase domain-containing protein [Acutalibacteraceae bacterium]